MWEHRSISDEYLRQNRRIQATETYVELMGQVERAVASPQSYAFDDEDFLQYLSLKRLVDFLIPNDKCVIKWIIFLVSIPLSVIYLTNIAYILLSYWGSTA